MYSLQLYASKIKVALCYPYCFLSFNTNLQMISSSIIPLLIVAVDWLNEKKDTIKLCSKWNKIHHSIAVIFDRIRMHILEVPSPISTCCGDTICLHNYSCSSHKEKLNKVNLPIVHFLLAYVEWLIFQIGRISLWLILFVPEMKLFIL